MIVAGNLDEASTRDSLRDVAATGGGHDPVA